MTNNELAWKIFEELNAKGAELGSASVGIIEDVLDQASPWIPVGERLPEYEEDVQVWSSDGVDRAYLKRWNQPEVWAHYSGHFEIVGVTHWRPLPAPPKS